MQHGDHLVQVGDSLVSIQKLLLPFAPRAFQLGHLAEAVMPQRGPHPLEQLSPDQHRFRLSQVLAEIV